MPARASSPRVPSTSITRAEKIDALRRAGDLKANAFVHDELAPTLRSGLATLRRELARVDAIQARVDQLLALFGLEGPDPKRAKAREDFEAFLRRYEGYVERLATAEWGADELGAIAEQIGEWYDHLEEGEERLVLLRFTDGIGELLPASGTRLGAAEALSQLGDLEGFLCPPDDLNAAAWIEDKGNELGVADDILEDDEIDDWYGQLLEEQAEAAGGLS